jgi:predicted thioesterase
MEVEAMSSLEVQPGTVGTAEAVVDSSNTAVTMKSGEVEVFATPGMVALMEEAAVAALRDRLGEGQTSVGVRLEVSHVAATPLGMKVRAEATVEEVDGRRVVYRVSAFDDAEKIGDGRHERLVVDRERFMGKVKDKES